ncbi:MAG: hypothetical protein J5628_06240 [Lachnospiraceae bacterium]|nr:hypothetical protein [Lachnospiraceae bacterium]
MIITVLNYAIALLLGAMCAVQSDRPLLVVALFGVLLTAITAESLCEAENAAVRRLLRIAVFVLSIAIAVTGGQWYGFVLVACVNGIPAAAAVGIAVVSWVVYSIVASYAEFSAQAAARTLVCAFAVALCVAAVRFVKYEIEKARAKEEIARNRLIRTSLSEMNERKINRELSQQSFEAERNARLLERENISRSIHNNVGHTITAAIMTLDAADMLFEAKPEEARKRMNDANDRIRGSLDSIRSAVRALDEEGGELPIADLERYLRNAIEDFTMDTERTVDFATDCYSEDIEVPREHVEFLTGVLQEAFTNGVKHGGAKNFAVLLRADSAHVMLRIKDDGAGDFDESVRDEKIASGFGLRKILAYAQRCGGNASFDNEAGFRTEVELPLQRR